MEMKVFNHILFDSLMPWLTKSADTNRMNECLKEAVKISPETLQDLTSQVNKLLSNKATLTIWLKKQTASAIKLKPLSYSTDLPDYNDTPTKYYATLIDAESQRIYNGFLGISDKYTADEELLSYHSVNALRNLKHYIVTAAKEIKTRQLDYNNGNITDLITFVLFYLKYKLIALYFSIQLVNKNILETVFELEDFYLMELNETKADVHPIRTDKVETPLAPKSGTLTFGFKGDANKLAAIVKALNLQIDFLNTKLTSVEQFIEVLTAKDLKGIKTKIYIDCATTEFQEITVHVKKLASKFTPTNISKSKLFYTKEGTLITDNLLYTTKNKSKISPERKDQIKAIFQNI